MRHFAWFDCLRCAAVLLVMAAHANIYLTNPALLPSAIRFVESIGWTGVELFFVLSGFLVSGLLFDEHDRTGRIDLKRFLIRRGFKIVPSFYVLILVTVIYDLATIGRWYPAHVAHDLLFLQSYWSGLWPHAWTLAVEVHFYLLLGLLLAWLARRRGARWLDDLLVILAGVLVACFLARWIHAGHQSDFDYNRDLLPSHLHLDVLAAGVLARYLHQYHPQMTRLLGHPAALILALAGWWAVPPWSLWVAHSPLVTAVSPTVNAFGFTLIVLNAARLPFPAGSWQWLAWPFDYLGRHSYGIYLWHLAAREWLIDPFLRDRGLPYLMCYLAAALAVGTFFSVVLEMPVLHLRNRLFPSVTDRSRAAADRRPDDELSLEPKPSTSA